MPTEQGAAGDVLAVRMLPGTSPGYYPAGDPRQGDYRPGVVYLVSAEKAEALIDGGPFELVDAPQTPTPEPPADDQADEPEEDA